MRAKSLIPWATASRRCCEEGPECGCILCLELRQCGSGTMQASSPVVGGPLPGNFILRRALPFVGREPSREWQEEAASDEPDSDYEGRSTLPEQQPAQRPANHRTVIYFGDTSRRRRRWDKDSPVPPQPAPRESRRQPPPVPVQQPAEEEQADECTVLRLEAAPAEIVLSVKPCRADVLRLEEDESKQEEYWSLPGDTTGFKADWSFVQQWRLRG